MQRIMQYEDYFNSHVDAADSHSSDDTDGVNNKQSVCEHDVMGLQGRLDVANDTDNFRPITQ